MVEVVVVRVVEGRELSWREMVREAFPDLVSLHEKVMLSLNVMFLLLHDNC
jgi:hypothetical protein